MPALKYDFRSPFLAARIITTSGQTIPLWVNANAGGGVTAESVTQAQDLGGSPAFNASVLQSLPYLTELTVTIQLAYLPIVTAVLNPPYREAIEFLNSPLIEWGQSRLEVQFGYTGGAPAGSVLSPVFSTNLYKPEINIGADTQITLNGTGTGGFSATTQQSGRAFLPDTRASIIETILRGSDPNNSRNIRVVTDDVANGSDERAKRLLLHDFVEFTQAWNSDWMAIWSLVRECNCTMLMLSEPSGTGMQLRIMAVSDVFTAQPQRTLRMYHYPSGRFGGDNTYPILSASSPQMAVYLPGAIRGITMSGIDSATRAPSYLHINDQSEANPRAGSQQGNSGEPAVDSNIPGRDADTGAGGQSHPGSPDNPSAAAQARAEFAAMATSMGINLELETIGIPDILPGEVIHVEGLGVRLTGDYGVLKVEHTIGTSGYVTKLTVVSNTGMLLHNGIQAYGNVNAQNPPAGQDSGGVAGAQNTQSVVVQSQPANGVTFVPG